MKTFTSRSANVYIRTQATVNERIDDASSQGAATAEVEMSSVVLTGVGKQFGDVEVIHDVSLAIDDGDFVALVGPSGCGKSTLLRLIAGLDDVTRGEISIGGRRVDGVAASERDVAMVFQSYALYPNMTVRQNIGFGLRLRGTPGAELARRVDAVAHSVGLADLMERRPRELSGGQRQRVAMARAIVREPAVFLFDEPLSNLDAALRVHMRAEIARLHRQTRTTSIYVTHDQVEAMTLARSIVVLDRGRIQQVGPPMELYRNPANRFVAGFLGSPAMAMFDVVVEGDRLRGRGIDLAAPAAALAGGGGRGLVLGIRPEHFVAPGEPLAPSLAAGAIEGRVELVELLGSDAHALCEVAGQRFTARLPVASATAVTAGDHVRFGIPRAHVHLFDAATGSALPRDT
jgi:multiple sugar transport system ATP-binding protein